MMTDRAIFLDKDGTLLENVPYNVEPRLMRLTNRAGEALRLLAMHFRLIVISNQSGVAHGYFAESALHGVERRLRQLLAAQRVELSGFYYCPHHPQGQVAAYRQACECRKPLPGMLVKAAAELGVELSHSWMIGDILDDIEAGRRAGCRTVLIDNGGETEWQISQYRQPDFTTGDLYPAAEWILAQSLDLTNLTELHFESVGNALRGVPGVAMENQLAVHGTPQRAFPTEACQQSAEIADGSGLGAEDE
jgi:D-glycero-D-manno-heptose 1,7-bisphosphate phosphatase